MADVAIRAIRAMTVRNGWSSHAPMRLAAALLLLLTACSDRGRSGVASSGQSSTPTSATSDASPRSQLDAALVDLAMVQETQERARAALDVDARLSRLTLFDALILVETTAVWADRLDEQGRNDAEVASVSSAAAAIADAVRFSRDVIRQEPCVADDDFAVEVCDDEIDRAMGLVVAAIDATETARDVVGEG